MKNQTPTRIERGRNERSNYRIGALLDRFDPGPLVSRWCWVGVHASACFVARNSLKAELQPIGPLNQKTLRFDPGDLLSALLEGLFELLL
jgi:hypothetical protein